ncbi:Gag-Pol polyprotein [Plecturocebus cupreus]
MAVNQAPVVTEVKPGAPPVRQRQYPILRKVLEEIQIHLKRPLPVSLEHASPVCPQAGTLRTTDQCRTCTWSTKQLWLCTPRCPILIRSPEGQKLFAFQWENLESGITTQYTWIWLPQGFKDSPTIFGEALAQDLQRFPTVDLAGQQSLGIERRQVISNLPVLKTRRQVREFLGAVGFCRLWIPNFAALANPLYEATKRGDGEPF